jgi:hypothetical protein
MVGTRDIINKAERDFGTVGDCTVVMGKCQEAGQVWCRSGESQESSFCDSEDKKDRCGGEGLGDRGCLESG